MPRTKDLRCCVCDGHAIGRQWHNRDSGFGICSNCVSFVEQREDASEMLENYGREGIHYFRSSTNDQS